MRRPLRQAAALGLALLFGASLASGAYGWHGCPHHGHGPSDAGSGAAAPTSPHSAGPHLEVRGDDAGPHPGTAPGACTCLGSCHAGASPVLASSPGVEVAAGVARAPAERATARRPHHRRPAYFLPFPHGPPALG